MKKASPIQSELDENGIHIAFGEMPEMEIPQDYFETFSISVIDHIKQEEFLQSLPKETPYDIPQGYFQEFDATLMQRIQEETLLQSLPRSMPYTVPDDYFTAFPVQVFASIKHSDKPLTPLTFSRRAIAKLSLAATLLLFLGIAFGGLIFPSESQSLSAEYQLATIPDEEITQYLLEHKAEIENNIAFEPIETSKLDLQKLENEIFDNTLNKISDEELLNYYL